MKTITDNMDEWNEDRVIRYGHPAKHGPDYGIINLPLPFNFKCKGYALAPVLREEDGTMLTCKTKVIKEGESIMDYDFSNCYVYDYLLIFSENPKVGKDFQPDFEAGYNVTIGRKIRFSGEATKK